uniref:Uncharacterized protein n=1 Tax=Rhizophora mucronata TaxID=61149 RepID=A0A2P2NH87_RHIMU
MVFYCSVGSYRSIY